MTAQAASDSGILAGLDKIIPGGFANILGFGLQIGLALAFGVFIYAGVIFITAGDNASKIKEAKELIKSAVFGVVLLGSGFVLLNVINPNLTEVKDVQIETMEYARLEINEQPVGDYIPPGPDGKYASVPLIKQAGGSWGQTDYGNCTPSATYAGAACGPTSLSMVVTYLTQTSVNPKTIGDKVVANGMRVCGSGTTRSAMTYIPEQYGLTSTEITGKTAIESCIGSGGAVIGIMRAVTDAEEAQLQSTDQRVTPIFTTGGHFIVVTGADLNNNMVYINDPGGRDVTSSNADHYVKYNNLSWCVKK